MEKILFWEDVWLCAISLAQKYPRLYSISRWKFCNIQLVISKWQELGSARWTRELRAWESDLEKEMSSLLGTLVFKDYKDLVIWKQNDNLFVTRDCYRLLEEMDKVWEGNWKTIWKLKVPPKIQTFLWKLEHNVLPTLSFLMSRIHINLDATCRLCKADLESSDHIFKYCKLEISFWREVANWWSLDKRQTDILLSGFWPARGIFAGVKLGQIWSTTLCAAVWTLWLARNELIFDMNKVSIDSMIVLLKIRSYKWSLAWGGLSKDLQDLWSVNPMGAFLLYCKKSKEPVTIWWNS